MKQITNVFKISEPPKFLKVFSAGRIGPVVPNTIQKSITKLTRDKELGNNFGKVFGQKVFGKLTNNQTKKIQSSLTKLSTKDTTPAQQKIIDDLQKLIKERLSKPTYVARKDMRRQEPQLYATIP